MADLASASDYYPGGMQMPSRNYQAGSASYAYGFNGKRKDPDMDGNNYDYGFRIYNPQIGKFLSVDPLMKKYPELTPYQFASNRPIDGMDFDGLEYIHYQWNIVSTAKLKNGNTDFEFKNWLVNGKKVEDWQYDKNVSGTVDKNWYLFNNKLYQYPYQIPGYSKWLKQKEEKQQRVIKDGLIITGGVIAIVATGGAAAPAVLGAEGLTGGAAIMAAWSFSSASIAVIGGTMKVKLDLNNQKEESEKIPTSLGGAVGATVDYMIGNKKGSFQTTGDIVDGFINLREIPKNVIEAADKALTITNISITIHEVLSDKSEKDETKKTDEK